MERKNLPSALMRAAAAYGASRADTWTAAAARHAAAASAIPALRARERPPARSSAAQPNAKATTTASHASAA